MPSAGRMACSCGYKQKEGKICEKKIKEKKLEIIDSKQTNKILPTVDADCEGCGHEKAYFWMLQTRSSDEPETRFFKCCKCGHQWREYD